ncbi:hypothetical protein A7985_01950 [Pseudoalteromonas luteoviolacea]|uniref:Uncharacterized protein n=1 Tax=Pseudoalteromonas luteoviolacea TaxID=43657 RepID=A0A1C0TU32_9GAMM|nr:hypothetical protein [Pseudoalteromonas luteoviolacea]OCQ22744.1 hypothetical protein A7985_01950 [Pseudoalteromonas luteoviolacea]
MFSYEKFQFFYDGVGLSVIPVYLIALLVGWKSINTRMLVFLLLLLECLDIALYDFAFSLRNNYGLYVALFNLLFLSAVIFRRLIAKLFKSHIKLCHDVFYNYYFSKQEAALIFTYFILSVVNIIAFAEAKLYQYWIIDSFPFRNNIYSPTMTILQLIESLVILKLASRTVPIDEHVLALKRRRKFERKRLTNMSEKKDR